MSMKTILTWLVAAVLTATIGVLVYQSAQPDSADDRMMKTDDAMMKNDDGMMQSSEAMMKSEDSMMQSSDAMMKDEGNAMMKSEDGMMKSEDSMMQSSDAMMKDEGYVMKPENMTKIAYAGYQEGVIGNGESSVLFFHAKWCPACRQADTDLQGIFGAGAPSLSVYKVDYDTETTLKSRYGVTYQHTFVVIDGKGNAIKTVLGPSKAELAALVK